MSTFWKCACLCVSLCVYVFQYCMKIEMKIHCITYKWTDILQLCFKHCLVNNDNSPLCSSGLHHDKVVRFIKSVRERTMQSDILPSTEWWMNPLCMCSYWIELNLNNLILSNQLVLTSLPFSGLSVVPQGCVLPPLPLSHWLFQNAVSDVSACWNILQSSSPASSIVWTDSELLIDIQLLFDLVLS